MMCYPQVWNILVVAACGKGWYLPASTKMVFCVWFRIVLESCSCGFKSAPLVYDLIILTYKKGKETKFVLNFECAISDNKKNQNGLLMSVIGKETE